MSYGVELVLTGERVPTLAEIEAALSVLPLRRLVERLEAVESASLRIVPTPPEVKP